MAQSAWLSCEKAMNRFIGLALALLVVSLAVVQRAPLLAYFERLLALRSHLTAPPTVKVAQVKKISIPVEITARGELEAVREEQAVSPATGYIEQLRFKTGDRVNAGQVIATFKIREAQNRLEQVEKAWRDAQTRLRDKETQLAEAEKRREIVRDLYARDLIARKETEDVETKVETARAERDVVKAQLEQQQAALAQLRYIVKVPQVVAPLSGIVTDVFAEQGGYTQSSWPILTIAAFDPLKVSINLSEDEAKVVHKGMNAQITPDGKPRSLITGQVSALDIRSAPGDKTAVAEVRIPNRNRELEVGTAVSVRLTAGVTRDALLIPDQALLAEDGAFKVYRVADDHAIEVAVAARPYRAGLTEVTQGLKENEWVIVDAPRGLGPNVKVRVEPGAL